MNSDSIWQSTPTKTEGAVAIPSDRVHALTTSTRFPDDELGSPRRLWRPDPCAGRMRRYLGRSPRRVLRRLITAVIKLALIAILMTGFVVAALFALDLADMLRW